MTCIKVSDVEAILPDGVTLSETAIQMAITSAECTVAQVADCMAHLPSTCVTQTTIYLAAHYAAATDNSLSVKSEKDGCCDLSATYGFKFGEGILGTSFGINANTMSGGCLAELDKQPVSFHSIGSC